MEPNVIFIEEELRDFVEQLCPKFNHTLSDIRTKSFDQMDNNGNLTLGQHAMIIATCLWKNLPVPNRLEIIKRLFNIPQSVAFSLIRDYYHKNYPEGILDWYFDYEGRFEDYFLKYYSEPIKLATKKAEGIPFYTNMPF